MSFKRNLQAEGRGSHGGYWSTSDGNNFNNGNRKRSRNDHYHRNYNICSNNYWAEHGGNPDFYSFNQANYVRQHDVIVPSHLKRRKYSASTSWEGNWGCYYLPSTVQGNAYAYSSHSFQAPPTRSSADASTSSSWKINCSVFDDEEPVFMTREEIDRFSPSRKDGIDVFHETHLRYSYCAFIQNLGMQLDLPQGTIGTAMVLCHRFFVPQSHACHDRFLIATAALFLAGKSEETPYPLNNVSETIFILKKFSYDWFEKYHDRVLEAELLILTTLNFELNVQHPYASLTSVLRKFGPSMIVLVNLALNLISEGLRSSLWLQFKPHHIAAGAAYLASKFLNIDLAAYHNIWQEFQATPAILQDVSQQLMELF